MIKLNFFKFTKSNLGILDLSAAFFRKEGRPVIIHLLRQMYLTGGRPTRAGIAAISSFLRKINLLKRNQGIPGVVKYLKGSHVLLQQIIAGHKLPDTGLLGPRIRRGHQGIPAIIPPHYRISITNGDTTVIRLWMTLFSTYRDMSYQGKASLDTIIDGPLTGPVDLGKFYPIFVNLFINKEIKLPSTSLFPILTASPTTGKDEHSTHHWSIVRSLILLMSPSNRNLMQSIYFINNFTHSKLNLLSLRLSEWLKLDSIDSSLEVPKLRGHWLIGSSMIKIYNFLGRLHIKPEAAGKMRVFAMVDPWTQWVLKSLHTYLFKQLSRHITDGTFNQLKPLSRVPFGKTQIDSLDLSAATDRLPLYVQKQLLSQIFGKEFADHWVNLMVNRDFDFSRLLKDYPELSKYGLSVRYSVGQPMGALSSWAMLALTHHFLVNCAAWQTGISKKFLFTSYAILGDDIAIWDKRVSLSYQSLMADLGVKLGIAKSIISPGGLGVEFAKRTLFKGMDVSPFPMKEARASHGSLSATRELQRKYQLSDLNVIRWLGYGSKVTPGKVSNKNMKLFQLLKEVPTTSGSLLQLFLRKAYIGPAEKDLLFKRLVIFLYKELNRIENMLRRAERELINHISGSEVNQNILFAQLQASNPAFTKFEKVVDWDYIKSHHQPTHTGSYYFKGDKPSGHITDSHPKYSIWNTQGKLLPYMTFSDDLQKKHIKYAPIFVTAQEIQLKSIITASVTHDLSKEYLVKISSMKRIISSHLYFVSSINSYVKGVFYPFAGEAYMTRGTNLRDVSNAVNAMFTVLDSLTSMSIQNLTHPIRVPSDKSEIFSGFETKRTIFRWKKWMRLFIEATMQGQTGTKSSNLTFK